MKLKDCGKIKFDPKILTKKHKSQDGWKNVAIVELSGDICEYYKWFIEKRFHIRLKQNIRGPHITIINDQKGDENLYQTAKNKWDGKIIEFEYDLNRIRTDKKHWWISASSPVFSKIRVEAGLGEKYYYGFHITIGAIHEHDIYNMDYILNNIKRFNI